MKKFLIVANWKMNPKSLAEAKKLFNSISAKIKNAKRVEVVICPPFVYLSSLASQQDPSSAISFGGQSCFWENPPTGGGAFTGEVSPLMLKNLGCQYVIVGHSERRRHQKETDEMVNKKIKAALKAKLKAILCIDKISQLGRDLKGISNNDFKNIIVAYEPLFAVGTGKFCSPKKAKNIRQLIRKKLGENINVLYGGSANSNNASSYLREAKMQGLLVGGASLNPREFLRIVRNAEEI